jgi:tetratricopeptide (TPR) repeat protein
MSVVNYNKRGLFFLRSSRSEALSCFLKAEMLLSSYPSVKLQFLTFNNLAVLYDSDKNYSKALQYLSQCSKMKTEDKSCKMFYIGSLLNQASILSKINRHDESITSALKALTELEIYQNPCLKAVCLYTIALEYEFLQKISLSEKYYLESKEFSKKVFDKDSNIFKLIEKGLKNIENRSDDPICILRDKTSTMKPPRVFEVKSRDTQKGDYYIKVDTTPWLEQDEWRGKSHSETPKITQKNSNLRKKYTRLSEDSTKSHVVSGKLEEKLNYIGNKLVNLSGKLGDIEKLFRDEKKKSFKDDGKKIAAIKIQRAFRMFLKKRMRKKMKDLPFFRIGVEGRRQERFVQTSRVGMRGGQKVKGLLQSIVFIQKWIRGFLARRKIKKLVEAAVKIQKTFRMFQVKRLFKGIKHAIVFIQQSYRSYSLKLVNK